MTSNPDEEWQAKRNEDIASFLPKGHAGNWNSIVHRKKINSYSRKSAGEMLVKWGYEKELNW